MSKAEPAEIPIHHDPTVYGLVHGIHMSVAGRRWSAIGGGDIASAEPPSNPGKTTRSAVSPLPPAVHSELLEFHGRCSLPSDDGSPRSCLGFSRRTPRQDSSSFPVLVEFKSYFPTLFSDIRARSSESKRLGTKDGNDANGLYRQSFTRTGHVMSYGSLANSGARFFFTSDMRYIVKTIPRIQVRFLRDILPRYAQYLDVEQGTMLARIEGFYRIRWRNPDRFGGGCWHTEYLMVMGNTLSYRTPSFHVGSGNVGVGGHPEDLGAIQVVTEDTPAAPTTEISYDLKSWGLRHPRDTRDLRAFLETARRVVLDAKVKQALQEQAQRDVEFLASIGVNDYSILLGILTHADTHSVALPEAFSHHPYAHRSADGRELYFVSFIDILSGWQWNRRLGYYLLPGIWRYFPRYTRPSAYSLAILRTLDHVLQGQGQGG